MNTQNSGVRIDLSGKAVLVTGASQGIGAEIARTFHAAGANVSINHPAMGSSTADAENLVAELNQIRGNSATAVAADVSDIEAVTAMVDRIRTSTSGGVDFLINMEYMGCARDIATLCVGGGMGIAMAVQRQ